jgi:hypothetical protein
LDISSLNHRFFLYHSLFFNHENEHASWLEDQDVDVDLEYSHIDSLESNLVDFVHLFDFFRSFRLDNLVKTITSNIKVHWFSIIFGLFFLIFYFIYSLVSFLFSFSKFIFIQLIYIRISLFKYFKSLYFSSFFHLFFKSFKQYFVIICSFALFPHLLFFLGFLFSLSVSFLDLVMRFIKFLLVFLFR